MIRILSLAWVLWLAMLRKKDLYVLIILLGALLVTLVSMNVFGLSGMTRYVTDTGFLLAWVFGWILSVLVSARELPLEQARGTIYPLLAKPVTRAEVIIGKWLGAWTVVSAATLAFYALIVAVVLSRHARLDPTALAQAYILHAASLAVIVSLAMLFSTRLNSDAASTLSLVITGASFLVVPRIPEFLVSLEGFPAYALMLTYHLLPHFEVFDLRQRVVHDFGPMDWAPFWQVILYGSALTAIFLLLAWMAFRNKRFVRGELNQ